MRLLGALAHPDLSRALLVLAGLLSIPTPGCAQTGDSLAFHKAQWGTEFNFGFGFVAAGVLYFTSPTHAFLLDIGTGYARSSGSARSGAYSASAVSVATRVGTRAYRAFGRRLYRLTTVGVSVAYSRNESTQDTLRFNSEGIGAGLFADLGATWLVTPHLGIGAKAGATITYTRATFTGSFGSGSENRLRISVGDVALVGQVYF